MSGDPDNTYWSIGMDVSAQLTLLRDHPFAYDSRDLIMPAFHIFTRLQERIRKTAGHLLGFPYLRIELANMMHRWRKDPDIPLSTSGLGSEYEFAVLQPHISQVF